MERTLRALCVLLGIVFSANTIAAAPPTILGLAAVVQVKASNQLYYRQFILNCAHANCELDAITMPASSCEVGSAIGAKPSAQMGGIALRGPEVNVQPRGKDSVLVQFKDDVIGSLGNATTTLEITYRSACAIDCGLKKLVKISGALSGHNYLTNSIEAAQYTPVRDPVSCALLLEQTR